MKWVGNCQLGIHRLAPKAAWVLGPLLWQHLCSLCGPAIVFTLCLLVLPTCSTRPTTGCGARSTLWVHKNLFWHGSGRESQQPLQHHHLRHLKGGWRRGWLGKVTLGGQYQGVTVPAYARTAHHGFLQKRLEEGLVWIVPKVPRQPSRSKDWTEPSAKTRYMD